MSKDTFISYSRRDQEFVTRLAGHLNAQVAPTVNSYKRLVPGYEAPVYIGRVQLNRSALIRIPCYQL